MWSDLDPKIQKMVLEKIETIAHEDKKIKNAIFAAIDELKMWSNVREDNFVSEAYFLENEYE